LNHHADAQAAYKTRARKVEDDTLGALIEIGPEFMGDSFVIVLIKIAIHQSHQDSFVPLKADFHAQAPKKHGIRLPLRIAASVCIVWRKGRHDKNLPISFGHKADNGK
jgi:hypothetical protein